MLKCMFCWRGCESLVRYVYIDSLRDMRFRQFLIFFDSKLYCIVLDRDDEHIIDETAKKDNED